MEDKKIMHFFKRAKRKILTNLVLKNFFLFFGNNYPLSFVIAEEIFNLF